MNLIIADCHLKNDGFVIVTFSAETELQLPAVTADWRLWCLGSEAGYVICDERLDIY